MRVDYTAAALLALEKAQAWARAEGADQVQPRHLLQGLLHEEEGKASLALAGAGVDPARVRQSAPAAAASDTPLPLSAALNEALRQAAEFGRLLSAEQIVASDQLLVALLREDSELRQSLEAVGLNVSRLEGDVVGEPRAPVPLDEPLDLSEPREQIHLGRVLDASANRAREALRVLEDACRFALEDAGLTRELKEIRHDLAAALEQLPPHLLLEARDTPGDVGAAISTAREHERSALPSVVEANAKRLQEALRSLEEYGKVLNPKLGRAIEAIRYRAYTLEKALVLGRGARERLAQARLYLLVTDAQCRFSLPGTIKEAAAGGVQIVQLREKHLEDRALLERAREVRRLTREAGVLFIMNDRPDLALLSQADGVHLGQQDMSVREARRILGPDAIIGLSTHNLDQVRQAVRDGVGYLGIGPAFPSKTKTFAELPGLEFVRQALAETSLPAFVIGGVNLENLPQVIAAGGRRLAVSQAICQAEDPRRTAAAFRALLR